MRKLLALPSVKYLRQCFDYNQETGELSWKVRPREHFKTKSAWKMCNTDWAGKLAGSVNKGYRQACVNGVNYRISRIVTKWMTGKEPLKTVDHRDTDPGNDKWSNLRPATHREQSWNRRFRKTNKSGFRGVSPHDAGWAVFMAHRYLGTFATREEAAAFFEAEARRIHGEFYREPEYIAELASVTPKRCRRGDRLPIGPSGFQGVSQKGKLWRARVWKNGRERHFGTFRTREEAHAAYCKAREAVCRRIGVERHAQIFR